MLSVIMLNVILLNVVAPFLNEFVGFFSQNLKMSQRQTAQPSSKHLVASVASQKRQTTTSQSTTIKRHVSTASNTNCLLVSML
jgi:hypothetical protein